MPPTTRARAKESATPTLSARKAKLVAITQIAYKPPKLFLRRVVTKIQPTATKKHTPRIPSQVLDLLKDEFPELTKDQRIQKFKSLADATKGGYFKEAGVTKSGVPLKALAAMKVLPQYKNMTDATIEKKYKKLSLPVKKGFEMEGN